MRAGRRPRVAPSRVTLSAPSLRDVGKEGITRVAFPRRTSMILLARASGYSTPRDPSRVASSSRSFGDAGQRNPRDAYPHGSPGD
ncbi:hypothetical protein F2Q69_00058688 [Brassica cretica]|uniref:Uncharacterized protein n=1 Tax=Brassica cretica TaxID=69181 RepID=A0A8S9RLR5_BRACR|nr:hypothetical protein F2Q69_00058688 [Brassica cretica]